jgi:AbrB family looped-hinge helix DNA binding protein
MNHAAYSDMVQRNQYRSEMRMTTVTVSPKFQVVIPKDVRERIGLEVGQKIHVFELEHSVLLVPQVPVSSLRGFLKDLDLPPFDRDGDRVL